jgi:hypothetical protein
MTNNSHGPDFICIGAQKAGTTWLYSILKQIPEVHFPGPKEVHFWDAFYDKGIEWYKDLYSNDKRKIQGDITPAYAILPKEKIKECYELNPNARIIYILRSPVERAWSLAMMNIRIISEKQPFEGKKLASKHFSDEFFLFQANLKGSLLRGDYATCLENWLSYYPKEQLLLLDYDDVSSKPEELIDKVLSHIGLENCCNISSESLRKRVFSNDDEPMRENFAKSVKEIYLKKIERLEQLTLKDFSKWK